MQHFLLKSEPHEYSLDDLAAEASGVGMWDGVRNYQARNVLRGLRIGDQGFFYHSSCKVVRCACARVCCEGTFVVQHMQRMATLCMHACMLMHGRLSHNG